MAKAEGRVFPMEPVDRIDASYLETFPYQGPNQEIRLEYPEFTTVCPFSGLPDFANVILVYTPARKCIELKSLKYYFLTYRNVGIYQEAVTARVHRDLKAVLRPRRLSVTTVYNPRGGLNATCTVK